MSGTRMSTARKRACSPPEEPSAKRACSPAALVIDLSSDSEDDTGRSHAAEKSLRTDDRHLQALRENLRRAVEERTYDLAELESTLVSTSRTIKKMTAWSKPFACLREFFQNTFDHLQLYNGTAGSLNAAVQLLIEPDGYRFMLGDEPICVVRVTADQITIDQMYTFPIHPRALDTGVNDATKAKSNTAGGFGDGFKTGALALLSLGGALRWDFEADGYHISWDFVSKSHKAVQTFVAGKVLAVEIHVRRPGSEATERRENHMRQTISISGAAAVLAEAVSKLQVFWHRERPEQKLQINRGDSIRLCTNNKGVNQLSCAPCPGVYVRGIWVCKPVIKDTITSMQSLDVTGRDRDHVHSDELVHHLQHLMRHCNRAHLKELLLPLRDGGPRTWLTTGCYFRNLLNNESFLIYIREKVFGDDPHAIYSSKVDTCDPIMKWATQFLADKGTPVVMLHSKADDVIFPSTSQYELKARCVHLLNEASIQQQSVHKPAIAKCLTFLGISHNSHRVRMTKDIQFCLEHETYIFIPFVDLTKKLLLSVINLLFRSGAKSDNFMYLMQACCEYSSNATLSLDAVQQITCRAKAIASEALTPYDLTQNNSSDSASDSPASFNEGVAQTHLQRLLDAKRCTGSFSKQSISPQVMAADMAGEKDNDCCCHHGELVLRKISQFSTRFGNQLYCARDSTLTQDVVTQIKIVAKSADRACNVIVQAMPSLKDYINNLVRYGFERPANYGGFCGDNHIIINLGSYVSRSMENPTTLSYSMITVITHEVAHWLASTPGHGPNWRDIHDDLMEVCLPFASAQS